ncbi:hypothetical protein LUZ60_013964 [Juncus effusus]|nr:hypothetical protein LUZ60_013964 [Juncus effusus]
MVYLKSPFLPKVQLSSNLLSKTNKPFQIPLQLSKYVPKLPKCANSTQSSKPPHHFVLVHGLCHGGWSWYKLATLLTRAGHNVTAPDLAACGLNLKRLDEVTTFEEYCEPLIKMMDEVSADEKVVLVGHSYGGLAVSLAMERFPKKISAAVFVTASMPSSTNPLSNITKKFVKEEGPKDMMDSKAEFKDGAMTSFSFGPKHLESRYYHLCQPEDIMLASMLTRPGRPFNDEGITRDDFVTAQNHGLVNRVYVVCKEDRSWSRDIQLWMAEMSPGTVIHEIDGSDHMPMLSKPKDLFSILADVAERYE